MYKRAARIYGKLKVRGLVGKKAQPRKMSPPALPSKKLKLPPLTVVEKKALRRATIAARKEQERAEAQARAHALLLKQLDRPAYSKFRSNVGQIAKSLVLAAKGKTSIDFDELLRRLPLHRPNESEIRKILTAFDKLAWLVLGTDRQITKVNAGALRQLLNWLNLV
jgi:hypothetical protein